MYVWGGGRAGSFLEAGGENPFPDCLARWQSLLPYGYRTSVPIFLLVLSKGLFWISGSHYIAPSSGRDGVSSPRIPSF